MSTIDYKAAGVDVAAGIAAVNRIKPMVEKTFSPDVLTPLGGFAAMFDLKSLWKTYHHPVLVQSIDGVGTKMMVAKRMQRFDSIGIDLVSATTNDIIVLGAKPLTLLDYIANDKLCPKTVEAIVEGIAMACLEHQISLVGGETAEMPGTYLPGELDLVGVITGVVEKDKAILGQEISAGDIVAGFASNGLHTNGYSLARKLFFEVAGFKVDSYHPDFSQSIGEELLRPHLNYTKPVHHLLKQNLPIKGMAHITGGGLVDNLPRILPKGLKIELIKKQIPSAAIFELLRHLGKLDDSEMYRSFNMGIGFVLIVAPAVFAAVQKALADFPTFSLYEIGRVVPGQSKVELL